MGWVHDSLLYYSFYFGVFQNFPKENIKKLKETLFLDSSAYLKRTLAKCRHPDKMELYYIVILICISFMTNDVEHLYVCFFVHLNIFLCKATVQGIFPGEMRTPIHVRTCVRLFIVALFKIAK